MLLLLQYQSPGSRVPGLRWASMTSKAHSVLISKLWISMQHLRWLTFQDPAHVGTSPQFYLSFKIGAQLNTSSICYMLSNTPPLQASSQPCSKVLVERSRTPKHFQM